MARRTKEDAQKTRAQILASALTLFVKNGYEKTTFTDIAERLKLTKGAVYWHFRSKEALLAAVVEEMHARFSEHISARLQGKSVGFSSLSELMSEIAERVVSDTKNRAFFLFLRTQVKWGKASMQSVREELLNNTQNCPFRTICKAVENDRAAGLVRADVNAEEAASICMAAWDGLIQSKIDGFLTCDLASTIRHAFDAVWLSIKKV